MMKSFWQRAASPGAVRLFPAGVSGALAKLSGGATGPRRTKATRNRSLATWGTGQLTAAMPDGSAVASPTICVAGRGGVYVRDRVWSSCGERNSFDFTPPDRSGGNRSFALPGGGTQTRNSGWLLCPPKSAGIRIPWDRAALGKAFAVQD